MATILNGKEASEKWLEELSVKLKTFKSVPTLALVRVGDDPASEIYLKKKEDACKKIGMHSKIINFPSSVSQEKVLAEIKKLNKDKSITGMIVQVPLPPHLDAFALQEAISPKKDVDGFGTHSMGMLAMGNPSFVSATPAGIMRLLAHYSLSVFGKHCVVVGRSNTVGKPLAQLLLMQNATVTIAHSKTKVLGEITRQADFLFVAVGKPRLITSEMVKPGAVIVDVGINRIGNEKNNLKNNAAKPELEPSEKKSSSIVGDVDFEGVKNLASYITPVPGGVGPMTVASLIANTILAYEMQNQ